MFYILERYFVLDVLSITARRELLVIFALAEYHVTM